MGSRLPRLDPPSPDRGLAHCCRSARENRPSTDDARIEVTPIRNNMPRLRSTTIQYYGEPSPQPTGAEVSRSRYPPPSTQATTASNLACLLSLVARVTTP